MCARSERALALHRELSGSPNAAQGDRLGDVGIDSLGLAELAAAIECEFGVDLAEARALDATNTVGDVLAVVDALRLEPPEGAPFGTGWVQGFAAVVGGWGLRRSACGSRACRTSHARVRSSLR